MQPLRLQKYPLARKLKPTELVMRAGDILVFPRNTCHQTRVLSVRLGVADGLVTPSLSAVPPAALSWPRLLCLFGRD